MRSNWEKVRNAFAFTSRTKSAAEERRLKVLQNKDYSNSQAFLQWLEMANTTIENNLQNINKLMKEQSDSLVQIKQLQKNSEELITPTDYRQKEFQEQISRLAQEIEKKFQQNEEYFQENDFLKKELAILISASFLESRKEVAKNSENQIEQKEINDLENTLEEKKGDLESLQKKVEEMKTIEKEKLIEEWENLKSAINYTNYISPMKNTNINNIKEFLTQTKQKWTEHLDDSKKDKNYEKGSNQKIIQELLPLLETFLQSSDSELKTECQSFLDKWESDYSEWIDVGGEKFWIKHYLETWDEPVTSELTSEQKQKLDDYDNLKQENERLKQELERKREEVKMGGLSVTPIPSGRNTPTSSSLRNLKLTSKEREDLVVQEWLDSEYSEKDQVSNINATNITKTKKLVGELVIKDFPALETIDLSEGGNITKLTIINCPQIEKLDVYNNQISELVGLENLAELRILNVASNQLKEIKISKNTKLFKFTCHENPLLTRIKGANDTTSLRNFSGGINPNESKNVVLNLAEEQKNKLIKMMKNSGMKDEELNVLSSKPVKEVRRAVKFRIQQLNQELGELVHQVGFDFINDPDWKNKLITKLGNKTLAEIPEPNDLSVLLEQQEYLKDREEAIKLALGIESNENLVDFPSWKDDLIKKSERIEELQVENGVLQVRGDIFGESLKKELGVDDEYINQILIERTGY